MPLPTPSSRPDQRPPLTVRDTAPSPWLRTIVAHVQDAIVVLDTAGAVIFESPSAGELLGLAGGDSLGAFRLERIHPDEREDVVRTFARTIAVPGAVARATYRFQRADGTWRNLEALAKNLVHEPYLHGVLVTFRDVTDRIRALEAAERAGRARDDFLSRMSHELRTPLHAVLGWSQLLLHSSVAEVQEAAEQIAEAGRHLLRLVDETLDLAAVREGRVALTLEAVPVAEALADALDLIRPLAAERDVQLLALCGGEGWPCVRADRDRLRQVLLNLLANAVKYNRFAGEVEVGWQALPGDRARISIRDTGPGIAEGDARRLFEPYERLDAGGVGSGLGLAISRRLVEMMGGALGVESRSGEGAVFWVILNRAP
jgi:PAS domain S-box-containing protein